LGLKLLSLRLEVVDALDAGPQSPKAALLLLLVLLLLPLVWRVDLPLGCLVMAG
jgi:hypothetical protein